MFSSAEADMCRSSSSFLQTNPRNQTPSFKVDGEFLKSKEFQSPDLCQGSNHNHHQQQQAGLVRYRSAPSSFLAALLDSATDNSSSGDESEAIFSAFMSNNHKSSDDNNNNNHMSDDGSHHQIQYAMKQEAGSDPEARHGYGSGEKLGYESAVSWGGGAIVGSYSVSMESENNGSTLMRQNSSPAGFSNGFGVMGEVGSYRVHNHSKTNSVLANGMSNPMSFSSGPSSSSRFMPSIPENDNQSIGNTRNPDQHGQLRSPEGPFAPGSWNESSSFNSLKRNRDGEAKIFASFGGLETQSTEARKNPSGLVHHLSLPKSFTEAADTEKFLQFQQDTVPCQIRAKRGCATHPRSIAERMRRTRISERMKKLQDLFPNMDKQTNTADMLDLAVEYIKDLQQQLQTLTDTRAKCVCSNKPQQTNPST